MGTVDVTQYKENVHIPKDEFRYMIMNNGSLSKRDLRVMCYLLTVINGFNTVRRIGTAREGQDPRNYTAIDTKVIARELEYSKSEIKESLQELCDRGLLEKGSSPVCKKGYRFTF